MLNLKMLTEVQPNTEIFNTITVQNFSYILTFMLTIPKC